MTERRNFFRTIDGSQAIPTNDGDYFTDDLTPDYGTEAEVYLEFFSDKQLENPVTPISGTIEFSASPLGNVFLSPSTELSINAEDVSFPDAAYTPLLLDGLIVKGRMRLNGITGASFVRAVLFTHE